MTIIRPAQSRNESYRRLPLRCYYSYKLFYPKRRKAKRTLCWQWINRIHSSSQFCTRWPTFSVSMSHIDIDGQYAVARLDALNIDISSLFADIIVVNVKRMSATPTYIGLSPEVFLMSIC